MSSIRIFRSSKIVPCAASRVAIDSLYLCKADIFWLSASTRSLSRCRASNGVDSPYSKRTSSALSCSSAASRLRSAALIPSRADWRSRIAVLASSIMACSSRFSLVLARRSSRARERTVDRALTFPSGTEKLAESDQLFAPLAPKKSSSVSEKSRSTFRDLGGSVIPSLSSSLGMTSRELFAFPARPA